MGYSLTAKDINIGCQGFEEEAIDIGQRGI